MSAQRLLDGRRRADLLDEMMRWATATLTPGGGETPTGKAKAIIDIAARIEEEALCRLDQAPGKQADNFYNGLGIGRDPARPARVPVALKLAETDAAAGTAPQGTRLMADAPGQPAIFETESAMTLAAGAIITLAAVDVAGDTIMLPPAAMLAYTPPAADPIRRRLTADAARGDAILQVDPPVGLKPGAVLRITGTLGTAEHDVKQLQDNLVTIDPPLDRTFVKGDAVEDVLSFDLFGSRNRQSHALYLGHATALDLKGAGEIFVSGDLPGVPMQWAWWGGAPEKLDWQTFDDPIATAGTLRFTKPDSGPTAKRVVAGTEAFWLRATPRDPVLDQVTANGLRLTVAAAAPDGKSVEYRAIAGTMPIVTTKPFYPFGTEPRRFDMFNIACAEAFAKAGARITLDFRFAAPLLGRLAVVGDATGIQAFALGEGGVPYRADFRTSPPTLLPVLGGDSRAPTMFSNDAPVAATVAGGAIHLVIGDDAGARIATLRFDTKLGAEPVAWTPLTIGTAAGAGLPTQVGVAADRAQANPVVFALFGEDLWRWTLTADGWTAATPVGGRTRALIEVQDSGALLRIDMAATSPPAIYDPMAGDFVATPFAMPEHIPLLPNAALAADGVLYVAGFDASDAPTGLTMANSRGRKWSIADAGKPRALTFEPAALPNGAPSLAAVAGTVERFFALDGASRKGDDGTLRAVVDPEAIGDSVRIGRQLTVRQQQENRWSLVQHGEGGLWYRSSNTAREIDLAVADFAYATREKPPTFAYAWPPSGKGESYAAAALADGRTLLTTRGRRAEKALASFDLFPTTGQTGDVDAANGVVTLWLAPGNPLDHGARNPIAVRFVTARGKESLRRLTPSATAGEWNSPGFPDTVAGTGASFELLDDAVAVAVDQAVLPVAAVQLRAALAAGYDRPLFAPGAIVEELGQDAVLFAHDWLDGDTMRLAQRTTWNRLGPNLPTNPDLSWEYWNGRAWWSLDSQDLVDNTFDFRTKGTVTFTAPDDLAKTDVAGQSDCWIRARLVGGDYGEATYNVDPTGKTAQRDTTSIHAPYVTSLTITYRLDQPVEPIVIAADSLALTRQTSANGARLAYPVFERVGAVMTGSARPPAPPPFTGCGDPCQPEPPADSGDAAGALAPTGLIDRALMIGFDKPMDGALSLYVDAEPTVAGASLIAETLRNGRFEKIAVLKDESIGLGQSGVLLLDLPVAPDSAGLFDRTAYWLRLRPKDGAGRWAPRLRGLTVNCAMARAVETRVLDRLGSSSGDTGQTFQLSSAPIDPATLEIRVRETLDEAAMADADVVRAYDGMDGPWVRWRAGVTRTSAADARVFDLDADTGTITFGDGKRGRIPPLGGDVLAVSYAVISGAGANMVVAGKQLTLLSPLTGVDKVLALADAAGGADVEDALLARRRAPAKLRHGWGQSVALVTLADLEEYALTLSPRVAQVRARNGRGGSVRMVVAMRGADLSPTPGERRELAAALASVASYGVARPGALDIVGPRLMAIAIDIVLEPRDPDAFADVQEAAREAIVALFDPAGGGHDHGGWPIGRCPDDGDIAAALADLFDRTPLASVTIARAGANPAPLPTTMPDDTLVTIARDAIRVEPRERVTA